MSKIYRIAKKIYFKTYKIPVLGNFLVSIAPRIHKTLREAQAPTLSKRILAQQIEILAQAIIALQNSVSEQIRKTTTQKEELKNELIAFKEQIESDMTTYKKRLEFIRFELFEDIRLSREKKLPKPIICNQQKYSSAVAKGTVRLNIGCGHRPLESYLNVDLRNLPGVDIVSDLRMLPFKKGTVTEIYTAHLIEHFTELQLQKKILPYWQEMLVSQGSLRLIVPDAVSMLRAYTEGEMPFEHLREVTFGAQDYEDDFHYTMFSPTTLKKLLCEAGFINIEIITLNRLNGKCREMEIHARKA